MRYKIVALKMNHQNDLFTTAIEQDPVGIPRQEYLVLPYPLRKSLADFKKEVIGTIYDTANRPFDGITVPESDVLNAETV